MCEDCGLWREVSWVRLLWAVLGAVPGEGHVAEPESVCSQQGKAYLKPWRLQQRTVYGRTPISKENRHLVLKRPGLPGGFQGRVFKDTVRESVLSV